VQISSLDQNEIRQLEGVDLDETFTDKASGKDVKRPQLEAMQGFVREGDRCCVTRWTGWPAISMICGGLFSAWPSAAFMSCL
jgi:DNA invertase Pin-like site-specific DNA recombinase